MTKEPVDPLLAALARTAREERDEEGELARFGPLTRADLPEEERAQLEEEAAQTPESDELLALLRPIDAAARGRMVAAAAAALRDGRTETASSSADRAEVKAPSPASSAVERAAAAPAPAAGAGGAVVPFRSRPRAWRGTAVVASALAIAAGVTLYVTTRGSSPALPAYEASIAGGVSTTRAPGDAPPTLVPGKAVRVRLRPEQAVTGRVTARAALRQGDRLVQLDGSLQTFEKGALALQLTVPADVRPGAAELILVVAGDGHTPAAVPADPGADEPQRRVLRLSVVIGTP